MASFWRALFPRRGRRADEAPSGRARAVASAEVRRDGLPAAAGAERRPAAAGEAPAASGGAEPPRPAGDLAAGLGEQVRRLELLLAAERELRQRLEEQAQAFAQRDPVTGLANSVRFEDRLAVAMAHARRQKHKLAVVQLSLDGFDALVDRLGRVHGDDLLRSVAVALERALRQGDTLARLDAGDAFTALATGIDLDADVTVIAEKLRLALRGPFTAGNRMVTASIGIAVFPDDGSDVDSLLQNAALAMQRARERGGDAWDVHAPGPRARAAKRVVREAALRQALAGEELALYWRPVLACGTRAVVGMEALLRWRGAGRSAHPSDFVSPGDVPNLSVPLGQWLLRCACREAAQWRRALGASELACQVGLSGRQLAHASLLELVTRVLEESGLPPQALRLAIGQRDLHTASPSALERLSTLRQMGIRVALQQFGTGDSRLLDPYDYPLDAVELDATVASKAPGQPESEAVVAATVALAHARGVLVLADGADTAAHAVLLARLGCDHMQGRVCGLPMPAADAEPWLRELAAPVTAPA